MKNTYSFFLKAKKHWHSRWYTDANYSELIHQDLSVREYIGSILKKNRLIYNRAIIKRDSTTTTVYIRIYQESDGIRRKGNIKLLNKKKKSKLKKNRNLKRQKTSIFAQLPLVYRLGGRFSKIKIETKHLDKMKKSISELTQTNVRIVFLVSPHLDAEMLAQSVARQIERRRSFRSITRTLAGKLKENTRIQGIRIQCSGRPTGKEIAFIQCFKYGPISPSTYEANVDYAYTTAWTKFGICGVKLWINFHK